MLGTALTGLIGYVWHELKSTSKALEEMRVQQEIANGKLNTDLGKLEERIAGLRDSVSERSQMKAPEPGPSAAVSVSTKSTADAKPATGKP